MILEYGDQYQISIHKYSLVPYLYLPSFYKCHKFIFSFSMWLRCHFMPCKCLSLSVYLSPVNICLCSVVCLFSIYFLSYMCSLPVSNAIFWHVCVFFLFICLFYTGFCCVIVYILCYTLALIYIIHVFY